MITKDKLIQICYSLIAILISLVVLTGCIDLWSKKNISREYYLEKSGENMYYLQWKGHEVDGVGLVEGTIEQIGWSDTIILVLRHACYRGDPDGWMVIDIKTHKVRGPISDSEKKVKFQSIICYPVEEAWEKL